MRKNRRGAVLIVVLGVLVVLALLATTFASLQSLDRSVARNYLDDVRAKLLAESGMQFGMSRIKEAMAKGFFSSGGSLEMNFNGNDLNENGVPDGGEPDAAYPPNGMNPPLEWAKSPSFALEQDNNPLTGAPTAKQIKVLHPNGTVKDVGISGTMETGTYALNGDVYSLRVIDTSGKIYINDGVYLYAGNTSSVSQTLKLTLNRLGWACGLPTGTLVGNQIVAGRPAAGFSSIYEVEKIIGTTNFNAIQAYICTQAWVDKNVVNPVPLSTSVLAQYPYSGSHLYRGSGISPTLRKGRGVNYLNQPVNDPLQWYNPSNTNASHNAVYALDELFPQYVEVVWRAPVNINTAPQPVLEALIADLQGFFWVGRRSDAPHGSSPPTFTYTGPTYGWSLKQITVNQNYWTWLYEMHTYDANIPATLMLNNSVGNGGSVTYTKPDRDELGFLYKTPRFAGSWSGTSTGGTVSATTIAQHIMACRGKGNFGGIDYANKPFGGPFKNWAQFHEFVDNLVVQNIINVQSDAAYIGQYWDYNTNNQPVLWSSLPLNQRPKVVSQAAADVLKANFNPNLHLNELNGDANMAQLVDKTDLIVNSTEFCFTPTGYFEIESLGRVLRPQEKEQGGTLTAGATDSLLSTGNSIIAEKKILSVVKLFDMYRETSQRHFYTINGDPTQASYQGSKITSRVKDPETNNNLSLEIGPAIDIGPLVYSDTWNSYTQTINPLADGYAGVKPTGGNTGWGFEHSGYIALPTMGGNYTTKPAGAYAAPHWPYKSTKGGVGSTLLGPNGAGPWSGGGHLGSVMHGHFALDPVLHHHASAFTLFDTDLLKDLAGNGINKSLAMASDTNPSWYFGVNNPKIEIYENYADPGETKLPPYDQVDKGTKYRGDPRSFRLPPASASGGSAVLPTLQPFTMGDMRIDGCYVERHSGLAYWIDQGANFNAWHGMASVWYKPSYMPELTGKARTVVTWSRWHNKNRGHHNPSNRALLFFPAHDSNHGVSSASESVATTYGGGPGSTGDDSPEEYTGGTFIQKFRPASLFWSWNTNCWDGGLDDYDHEGPYSEFHSGYNTYTLNHGGHTHAPGTLSSAPTRNYLQRGQWTHVALSWGMYDQGGGNSTTTGGYCFVNGRLMASSPSSAQSGWPAATNPVTGYKGGSILYSSHWGGSGAAGGEVVADSINFWSFNGKRLTNSFRLGEVSTHNIGVIGSDPKRTPRNFSGDGTYDELYLWSNDNYTVFQNQVLELWRRGRYYKPSLGNYNDALFISGPIDLSSTSSSRVLPPPTTILPPVGTGGSSGGSGGGTVPPPPVLTKRLLGVAWTTFAETYTKTGVAGTLIPVMNDYRNYQNANDSTAAPIALEQKDAATGNPMPCARVFVEVDGAVYPPSGSQGYTDDGYSQTVDAAGNPIPIVDPTTLKYRVWFQILGVDVLNTVLLYTPYFDDITLFYDNGEAEYLVYSMMNTTTL